MSKGKTQASNGDVRSHLSAFNPINTPNPMATNNCVPRLAYFKRKLLLLVDGCLRLFIVAHLHHIGSHVALTIKSS